MTKLLESINSPADLKKLDVGQLSGLADEIRTFIVSSVSRTGGHLASNLGVVELTCALHYVFDFSKDKLLWDVGHQCYTHKIITGRKDKFAFLREAGVCPRSDHEESETTGISGFPNPAESEYDIFSVGHAGTAISTAIGMAMARERSGGDEKIVAIVGDASIVNGVSFEALNNLGLVKGQLLIVLNDNSMAIDTTVGALAKYFAKLRLTHTYEDIVRTTSNILEHLPVFGKSAGDAIERIKKSIRMVIPASQMFESLNIPYFGPVDGYDVKSLVQLFGEFRHLEHPAILHVYTKKGKGFAPAEEDRAKYHSTGPFEINGQLDNPQVLPASPLIKISDQNDAGPAEDIKESFTAAFGRHLVSLAEKDDKIIAVTSAMCDGTGLAEFREKFGDRFYDVGIAESAAVDIAAGLAKGGLKPVVCIYSTFLQRSFDQIFQEVSLQNLGVVFCVDRAGFVGADGPTHHGMMDIGFLRMMPNMVLLSPSDAAEMRGALDFALGQSRPTVLRYPKDIAANLLSEKSLEPFELGRSVSVTEHKNSKVAIVSYGSVLAESLDAAKRLSDESIDVDVIGARFAAPIDEKIISLLEAGKDIITVEDHGIAGGFGSGLLEAAAQKDWLMKYGRVKILGCGRRFIGHDSRKAQLMEAGVNADRIIEAVRELIDD